MMSISAERYLTFSYVSSKARDSLADYAYEFRL